MATETLTRPCKTCGELFGKWRTQCPICGTPAEQLIDPITHASTKPKVIKHPCVLCKNAGANRTCVKCGGLIHKSCREFHEANCQEKPMALITCSQCGATCRLPLVLSGRVRCGKCKRDFTPAELLKATPETKEQIAGKPPAVDDDDFDLEQEEDGPLDDDDDDDE